MSTIEKYSILVIIIVGFAFIVQFGGGRYLTGKVVANQIVLNLPLDNSFSDTSGLNNVTNNGATFSTDNIKGGYSGSFAGAQNIKVNDNSYLNPDYITMAGWIKLYTYTSGGYILSKDDGAGGREYVLQESYADGVGNHLRAAFWNTTNSLLVLEDSSTVIPLNQWVHVAATYDGSQASLYVNGAKVASAPFSGAIKKGGYVPVYVGRYIGTTSNSGSFGIKSLLDELKVYNYALSANDVSNLYNNEKPVIATAPVAPTGLTAANGTNISLSWAAVSGATSYNVYRGTLSGGEGATPIATSVTSTSYINTGLAAGTTYYYKVSAVNNVGESALSSEVSASPLLIYGAVESIASAPGKIQLSWNSVSGASDYHVYEAYTNPYGSQPFTAAMCAGIIVPGTENCDINANYFQATVQFMIKPVINGTESGGSNTATLICYPQNITNGYAYEDHCESGTGLIITPGINQINLSWVGSVGATGYNVYRSTVSGSEVKITSTPFSSTTYTDTGLTAGTTYYYKISAVSQFGERFIYKEVIVKI